MWLGKKQSSCLVRSGRNRRHWFNQFRSTLQYSNRLGTYWVMLLLLHCTVLCAGPWVSGGNANPSFPTFQYDRHNEQLNLNIHLWNCLRSVYAVDGWRTPAPAADYVSSSQLFSTVIGLSNSGYVNSNQLASNRSLGTQAVAG
jgi:hypothetical protein